MSRSSNGTGGHRMSEILYVNSIWIVHLDLCLKGYQSTNSPQHEEYGHTSLIMVPKEKAPGFKESTPSESSLRLNTRFCLRVTVGKAEPANPIKHEIT
jgi:hypothetical protein